MSRVGCTGGEENCDTKPEWDKARRACSVSVLQHSQLAVYVWVRARVRVLVPASACDSPVRARESAITDVHG